MIKPMTEMTFGTRKLQFQKVSGAYNLNVPKYAVKTLGLRAGDDMRILLTDEGSLRIEKEHDRVVGAELPRNDTDNRRTTHIQRSGCR